MNRRNLFGAALALMAAIGLVGCKDDKAGSEPAAASAAPAQTFHWKMVTAWPKNYPGLGTAAERLADRINAMSAGRLTVKVYAAGELVPALEVFDAVSRGTAEMGHGTPYYWKGKVPAAQFFSSVPFGLSTLEMNAWLSHGGGQALWDETYAPFGVKPLSAGNTTMQMGGWFNKEINTLADIQGLKIRMPGLGGEVWSKLGAITVNLPGGEIFTSLQTGAIDATDWVSPYNDLAFGLHQAAKYYYFPGWQEPQAVVESMVNQKAFDALPADLQAIVVEAARASTLDMMDDYVFNNAKALQNLKDHGVQFKRFPDEVLQAMRQQSEEVLDALAAENDLNARILNSQRAFLKEASAMHELSEKELYNWR
ncbi:TRAP-type mannitol/chloroaromatic compound transport system substrate-binding protein [Ectopseudomonas oleovorans]|uniref:TRAP-type mannitol/chloroaromatic compound transport system substrate-binding protein n=2 Tax=Pseudomonadaceae TaxID=135621 RepID=A0A397M7K4_ECTOL|nr:MULTISPECIES: TRAP transporter substrate-binding protein [Pseudomonas]QMV63332.1 TRAP transporter substrate-binding protein [Pseudomonas berkeleyensis]RIA19333.1 TRAP-type mannitol/chloroaromatic compound transport system substrate-binding protein [Pseudomonas oleovorans]WSO38791.1 TRAP transporter substrate-binding protein [Pseudomonas berkeleyensis]